MGKRQPAGTERISLHGPDPEDVLRALLKVDPGSAPAEPDESDAKPAEPAKDS